MDRDISECHIAIAGEEGHTPVILGEPGDTALLGVVTLENLGLVFDPFKRELQPMKMLLA
jgi:predicted aspartyl protease